MAEQALVLMPAVAQIFVLGLLIAPRNAARVALGRVHVGSALIELPLFVSFVLGALPCAALRFLAVRRHRFSCDRSSPFGVAVAEMRGGPD